MSTVTRWTDWCWNASHVTCNYYTHYRTIPLDSLILHKVISKIKHEYHLHLYLTYSRYRLTLDRKGSLVKCAVYCIVVLLFDWKCSRLKNDGELNSDGSNCTVSHEYRLRLHYLNTTRPRNIQTLFSCCIGWNELTSALLGSALNKTAVTSTSTSEALKTRMAPPALCR